MKSNSPNWDPAQYGKFAAERMRPVEDLLARIPLARPASIYDLGCGDGRVTRMIGAHWPKARITGLDSSPDMLAAARNILPDIDWVEADLASWTAPSPGDLVIANASLHWIDGHEVLFPRLAGFVAPGGVLAVQMPRNFDAASHQCMRDAAKNGPWKSKLLGLERLAPVMEPAAYYDILADHAETVNVWETDYVHALKGDDPVVEWTMGTGLRPYFDRLDEPERAAFLADYRARIAEAYPRRPDGITLFPFRRLFIVATR